MKIHLFLLLVCLLTNGCSFMSDVSHAVGDFNHGLGDAFENQAARKQGKETPNDFKSNARRSYDYSSPKENKKKKDKGKGK